MNKITFSVFAISVILLTGCGSSGEGELTGVLGRKKFFEPEPLQMAFIPAGSFVMGPSDQDAVYAQNAISKTVTVDAFWMDQTEITNNQYRQFVYWVRDSILRTKLGEAGVDGREYFMVDDDDNVIDPPVLNWDERIDPRDETTMEILEEMYYPPEERFNGKKEFDVRKLNYSYYWVDYQQAARSTYVYDDAEKTSGKYVGQVADNEGVVSDVQNRSSFIKHNIINVYPDTLCWIRDFTYSFNDPQASLYFWHPSFDDYPVVGISWVQATAFSTWRTDYMNNALRKKGIPDVHKYRLPLETEWEYAARGGLDLSMYPWGGPYTRNNQGCFLANFKPLRGNYVDDGNVYAGKVGSYEPNEYGLFDMAGNVAEWTSGAFHPSAYIFQHDLQPNYEYNAKPQDPPIMKRKVIRGGSWKDIAYFLQTSARDYEYQDSTKPYVGFRNVRSYIGVN
ncbi:MAG: SUMF1/EgtB/PvdO family nonheme iron enzyme [Bacteroidales bacterium]|jgi:formylglycine-generating enzyme required for sulfatase activity|nr:SUMF1/EgtB/PvdO family nonheme iron enzyme [Bacteroidales bacterium]